MVSTSITQIGNRILPVLMPENVFFIIVSPCVSGKTLTIFCIAFGIIGFRQSFNKTASLISEPS